MPSWDELLTDLLTPYALPCVLALCIKLYLLWRARRNIRTMDRWLLVFLAALFSLNFAELISFGYVSRPEHALPILQLYYLSVISVCVSILGLAFSIQGMTNSYYSAWLICLLGFGVICVIIPGFTIAAAESIGYSITRVTGERYWILQIIIVGSAATANGILLFTCLKGKTYTQQKRAFALLLAQLPTVLVVFCTLIAMQLGVRMNAVVVTPLAVTILLAVLIYVESDQHLFKFLSHIPMTSEYQYFQQIRNLWCQDASLEEAKAAIERITVFQALQRAEGDKNKAADILGISPSTMRRKLNLIDPEDQSRDG